MRMLLKVALVELKLLLREPMSIVFAFAFPLIVMIVISGSFPEYDPEFGGLPTSVYYATSYLPVVIAAVALAVMPSHLANYHEAGVLRRFNASGVSTWHIVGAQVVVGTVITVASATVLLIANSLIYGLTTPKSIPLLVLMFLVGSIAFLLTGCLIGLATKTPRAAQTTGMLLFFPLWLLCGAGPPPGVMSSGMRAVSDALPLTFLVQGVQEAWSDGSLRQAAVIVLVVLAIGSLIGLRLVIDGNPFRQTSATLQSAG